MTDRATDLPRISIVTPSFNQGQFIEETIKSVLDQEYPSLQYIVIDGGSTDNTVDIIRKYEDRIDYWVSEPDEGQSDAINKGIEKCDGEIFNWLNSDDLLAPGTLKKLSEIYRRDCPDVICGKEKAFKGKIQNVEYSSQSNFSDDSVMETLRSGNNIQPATFLKMSIVRELAPLSNQLHYVMDMEWWWKYFLAHGSESVVRTDTHFAYFRLHEDSKTVSLQGLFGKDVLRMLSSIFDQLADSPRVDDFSRALRKSFHKDDGYQFKGNIDRLTEKEWCQVLLHRGLKVARHPHRKDAFQFAYLFTSSCLKHADYLGLDPSTEKELKTILSKTRPGSWNIYRMRRKIRWMLKGQT